MSSPVAICVGNFDGVHAGHVRLVETARAAAGRPGTVHAIVFEPHPTTVLRPERAPARLTRFADRAALLRAAGADEVTALAPTPDLLGRAPETFVDDLVARYRPSFIVEGPDFRFGRGRAGSVETLRSLEAGRGYETIVIDPVERAVSNGQIVPVSSSVIRWLVARGRVADAAMLLGRPYELSGAVIKGDQRGRAIGMPTANIDHGGLLLPADGIYTGRARRGGGAAWWPAAISVGTKPTFGVHPRVCEAHLVGFDGPLDEYGWTLRLEVRAWLRDQVCYPCVASLADQLARDIERARVAGAG